MTVAEALRPTAQPASAIKAYDNHKLYERFVADHGGTLKDGA
jgi:hypothetical protein